MRNEIPYSGILSIDPVLEKPEAAEPYIILVCFIKYLFMTFCFFLMARFLDLKGQACLLSKKFTKGMKEVHHG